MRVSRPIAAMIGLLAITAASAAEGPTDAYFAEEPNAVSARLADMCMDRQYLVVEQDEHHVLCSKETSGLKGILAQVLIGNAYSTTPVIKMRFALARGRANTRVQASGWIETQMAFGQMRQIPLDGRKQQGELMAALISAGGSEFPVAVPAPASAPVLAAEPARVVAAAQPAAQAIPQPVLPQATPLETTPVSHRQLNAGHVQCVTC